MGNYRWMCSKLKTVFCFDLTLFDLDSDTVWPWQRHFLTLTAALFDLDSDTVWPWQWLYLIIPSLPKYNPVLCDWTMVNIMHVFDFGFWVILVFLVRCFAFLFYWDVKDANFFFMCKLRLLSVSMYECVCVCVCGGEGVTGSCAWLFFNWFNVQIQIRNANH
jgi:hypothetical protein